jgi:pyruvate/2-oxoglutarate dehydrogenase complex dihydrolipoamide acyltransferase (E2) component
MPARDLSRWQSTEEGVWTRKLSDEHTAPDDLDATEGALEAAQELGIEIADVVGSGKDGRVTKADVEAYASE